MQQSAVSAPERGRYRFGPFEFDAATLELSRNGRPVKARPQSLKVLTLLLARASELVSRADLQESLWGADTFVDYEQGVNHCIKELRAALGDTAESPRYIETLARRGYRFIAPVEPVTGQPLPVTTVVRSAVEESSSAVTAAFEAVPRRVGRNRGPSTVSLVVAGALVVAVAAMAVARFATRSGAGVPAGAVIVSVAPFAVQQGDPALGIGLSDAISHRLGGQPFVAVKSQGRLVTGLSGRSEGASHLQGSGTLVLDGEISTSGETVSVVVELKNASTDGLVWSNRFRVRADELFSIEDVIAERVVSALGLRLAAGEQDRLRRRYTSNTAAYEDYLRGRAAMVRYTPAATLEAVKAYENALQRDPGYALARAGLAMACADMCLRFAAAADVERWGARSESEARAALDLDPDLAEAHLARAAVARKREFDWNTTIAASRRAVLLNPNLDQAHFFMAAAYYHLGYMQEALIAMERGRALRGGDIVEPLRIEALVALFKGDFAPAVARLEEVSRLSSQAIGDTYLGLATYYNGGVDRARTMLESLAGHSSQSTASRSGAALAGLLAAQGQTAAARAQIGRVVGVRYRDHHVAYSLGAAYAQLGDMNLALQWLRTAADTGFPCLPWFERDPLLEPVRRRADFAALLAYVRQRRDSTLSTLD